MYPFGALVARVADLVTFVQDYIVLKKKKEKAIKLMGVKLLDYFFFTIMR